mmetsp:Transcript_30319/g.48612  ORF Transcript_30319/g.48612 Transcript_30319/m.48612 type:complete len:215 (-) Transcript_30319:405-1049(-)
MPTSSSSSARVSTLSFSDIFRSSGKQPQILTADSFLPLRILSISYTHDRTIADAATPKLSSSLPTNSSASAIGFCCDMLRISTARPRRTWRLKKIFCANKLTLFRCLEGCLLSRVCKNPNAVKMHCRSLRAQEGNSDLRRDVRAVTRDVRCIPAILFHSDTNSLSTSKVTRGGDKDAQYSVSNVRACAGDWRRFGLAASKPASYICLNAPTSGL